MTAAQELEIMVLLEDLAKLVPEDTIDDSVDLPIFRCEINCCPRNEDILVDAADLSAAARTLLAKLGWAN